MSGMFFETHCSSTQVSVLDAKLHERLITSNSLQTRSQQCVSTCVKTTGQGGQQRKWTWPNGRETRISIRLVCSTPASYICTKIVAKANGRAALIRKCFVSHNPYVMVRAFKVYVRPMLEYAVSVWSPCYNYAIDKVESVQRNLPKDSGDVEIWITQLDSIIFNYRA